MGLHPAEEFYEEGHGFFFHGRLWGCRLAAIFTTLGNNGANLHSTVSHSSVLFPVKSYLDRVEKMADELARLRLAELPAGTSAPEQVLEVVDRYLYEEKVGLLPFTLESDISQSSSSWGPDMVVIHGFALSHQPPPLPAPAALRRCCRKCAYRTAVDPICLLRPR